MRLVFSKLGIEKLPKAIVRVRLTSEERSTRRLVREEGFDTIEIGAGKPSEMSRRRFIILCRAIVQTAKANKAKRIAIQFDTTPELFKNLQTLTPEAISELASQNFVMSNFEFTRYKTAPKNGWNTVEEITLCGKSSKSIEAAARRGLAIGEGVNACRALSNTPGGEMTPRKLAQEAKKAVSGLSVSVTTLGRTQMEKLGMGAVLGVAEGSDLEPTFTIMQYKGATGAPIVLAGKGITFDSGGLNLKPSNAIYEMHMDMSGAASVIHTIALAARLKVKKHVIALIPAAENMPSGSATRPGDILTSLSGKTIEVLNTDAEGRLVLADALTYAKRFKPSVVLDSATLTGAAHVALGDYASGLFTKDDELANQLTTLGEEVGDFVWRLPLWDEYEPKVKGIFADLANSSSDGSRNGGATNGAMFLWQFAKDLGCPWAHIDIAPRMTSAPGDELAKGAAGAPVRLMLRFIESWKP